MFNVQLPISGRGVVHVQLSQVDIRRYKVKYIWKHELKIECVKYRWGAARDIKSALQNMQPIAPLVSICLRHILIIFSRIVKAWNWKVREKLSKDFGFLWSFPDYPWCNHKRLKRSLLCCNSFTTRRARSRKPKQAVSHGLIDWTIPLY